MRRVVKYVGVAITVAAVALGLYGFVGPRLVLDERHYEVGVPALPPGLEGTEVAVFADLQVGMWLANTGMVRRVVERVVADGPDAVVIAGDFVYSGSPDAPGQVETAMELLAPLLDSGIPVFAVLGNHDYAADVADLLARRLEEGGVSVLRNDSASVPMGGDEGTPLYVVGLDAHRPGRSRPDVALRGVPDGAPRFVAMHNPASFPAIDADMAPLSVAGHTHCGQIAIPGAPTWSYLELLSEERIVVDGFASPEYGAPGNRLFVTCGIGFSRLPIRIFAPPQLATFELRRAPP